MRPILQLYPSRGPSKARLHSTSAQRLSGARSTIQLLLISLGLGLWLWGCMPPKLQALERYSRACKRELTPRFERYIELFQQSHKAKDRAALKAQLSQRVLPALDAYVTALQQIRPKTRQLTDIHKGLTEAYTRWHDQLKSFAAGLTSDAAWVKLAARMPTQIAAVARAEKHYMNEIKEYARPPRRRR